MLSACSSLLIIVDGYNSPVLHFTHFSAKEYLRSKRLAEAKDAILFPRIYDMGPDYHHASLPRNPKISNMISSKLTSWRVSIVFVGRLHCTIRSTRIPLLPCSSTEINKLFEVSAATLHRQAITELKNVASKSLRAIPEAH